VLSIPLLCVLVRSLHRGWLVFLPKQRRRNAQNNQHRCDNESCVTVCREKALKPVQTQFSGFSAKYRYTTFGMASQHQPAK
jgi:hypothetical protein